MVRQHFSNFFNDISVIYLARKWARRKSETRLVKECFRACLHGGRVPPANRATRLTELPGEG